MTEGILIGGIVVLAILFIAYDRSITKEIKACHSTIETQHAMIEALASELKSKEGVNNG